MSQYTRAEVLRMIEENGGPESLTLVGVDLSGIDLGYWAIHSALKEWQQGRAGELPIWYSQETQGINLKQANLQGSNLQNTDLTGANLSSASIRRASLERAKLDRANLYYADFYLADLNNASIIGASLQKTIFFRANLSNVNLSYSNLQQADLSECNLQNADLTMVNLQRANLSAANLENAKLVNADLRGTYYRSSQMGKTRIRQAVLTGSNIERVDLAFVRDASGVHWHNALLERTKMPGWKEIIPIGEEIAKRWDQAKEAYLLLKDNYNDLGHFDSAREMYIKEREMERKAHQQHKRWWPWLWLTLFRWTSTYGQNPVAVLLWTVGWVVIFAATYASFLAGGMRIASDQWTAWWPILHSMASFATLEFSGFEAVSPWAKFATSIQSLLGIFWLAYFVYALANRTRSF